MKLISLLILSLFLTVTSVCTSNAEDVTNLESEFEGVPYASKAIDMLKQCVETSFNTKEELDIDLSSNCISIVTEKCFGLHQDNGGMSVYWECISLESRAWEEIQKDYFSKLTMYYLKEEENIQAQKALQQADEKWKSTRYSDCDYLSLRWGKGTNSIYDSYKCVRDAEAMRALKYRKWLRTLGVVFLYKYE